MSAKKTDISQIRKYLNGELDARAMHKLERKAQDDPFLMDALEGYAVKKDQQANIDDLHNRLAQRINKGPRKIITLWPLISVAATILIFIGIGAWWVLVYRPTAKTVIIAADKTQVAVTPVVPEEKAPAPAIAPFVPQHHEVVNASKPQQMAMSLPSPVIAKVESEPDAIMSDEPVAKADVKAVTQDTATKNVMLREVTVAGYPSQRKRDITGSVAVVQPADMNKQLQSRVEGVTVTSPGLKQHIDAQFIVGQVVSKGNLQPLPGVSVMVNGTLTSTLTDNQGKFKVSASKNDKLNLGYIGYEPQTVKIKGDSLNIALNPSNSSLSEVVVVGYGTQNITEKAHPVNGWKSFDQYLAEHTNSPDGKTGIVSVSFIINTDNSFSNFKVVKNLSAETDAEAIRLIKEGPKWVNNAKGEPETVTVKVNFKK